MTKYIIQAEPDVVTKKYMTALTDSVLANAVTLGLYKRGTVGSTVITGLSVSHAAAGAQLTITGTGFGSTRGTSSVQFGEPLNLQGWRPCTKEAASYVNWGATSITVTVPAMSPGKAGSPHTYHRVRVCVGGVDSNAADFYMDPVTTINSSSTQAQAQAVFRADAGITKSGATITASGSQGCDLGYGTSNVLFDGITFVATETDINGNNAGVITIGEGNQNVTFVGCHVTGNWPGGWLCDYANAVKLKNQWSGSGTTQDITIADTYIESCSRMGIESTSAGQNTPRLAIRGCELEPMGSQSISFVVSDSQYALVEDTLVRGYNCRNGSNYSGGLESNASRHIEWRNVTVWSGANHSMNFSNTMNASPIPQCYMVLDGVIVDWTKVDPLQTVFSEDAGVHVIGTPYEGPLRGIIGRNCDFNLGNDTTHVPGSFGPFQGALEIDFTGCTVHGHYWGAYPNFFTNWDGNHEAAILAAGNIMPTKSYDP